MRNLRQRSESIQSPSVEMGCSSRLSGGSVWSSTPSKNNNGYQTRKVTPTLKSTDYGRVVWATLTGWIPWPGEEAKKMNRKMFRYCHVLLLDLVTFMCHNFNFSFCGQVMRQNINITVIRYDTVLLNLITNVLFFFCLQRW